MITSIFIVVCMTQAGDGSAITPTAREGWALARHNHINEVVQEHKGQVEVVFIGDSITQGWEGAGAKVWKTSFKKFRSLNLGIGGDRTEHLLWRFDHGNLDGIEPQVAVVMIGTNNFGYRQDSTEEVYEGIVEVVKKLIESEPQVKVLLLDIFPRGASFNGMRGELLQVNQALQATFNKNDQVTYFPIGHLFIDPDGSISKEIMPDQLHLSELGYQRWADAVVPQITSMLDRTDSLRK